MFYKKVVNILLCEARVKIFQKLLIAPATIAIALAPNLSGFAKESNKSNQEKNQSSNNTFIIRLLREESFKEEECINSYLVEKLKIAG